MNRMRSYSFDEHSNIVKSFHDSVAPGVMIGGYMVDLAYHYLTKNGLYNVIRETEKCLPDAVQLLTSCTIGNQRLKIIDVGHYALTFYEKNTGIGVRVYPNSSKIDIWPEIKGWHLKLTAKRNQT